MTMKCGPTPTTGMCAMTTDNERREVAARLRRVPGKGHRPPRNGSRRKTVAIVAHWCVAQGVPANKALEACAEAAGCTPQMMRLVLPQLVADERRRAHKNGTD